MKTRIAITCVLLAATGAMAGPYEMAKQQARRASAQNAAEQQRTINIANGGPVTTSSTPSTPAAPETNPTLEATLNNIHNLLVNFTALVNSTNDKPDPVQKVSLLNNLSAAALNAKASSASVKSLANDLLTAVMSKKTITPTQLHQLAAFVHATFNASRLTSGQQTQIFDGVQKILTHAGVSTDDAVNVVTDLKKIAEETK